MPPARGAGATPTVSALQRAEAALMTSQEMPPAPPGTLVDAGLGLHRRGRPGQRTVGAGLAVRGHQPARRGPADRGGARGGRRCVGIRQGRGGPGRPVRDRLPGRGVGSGCRGPGPSPDRHVHRRHHRQPGVRRRPDHRVGHRAHLGAGLPGTPCSPGTPGRPTT